jgi:hypothetical protein
VSLPDDAVMALLFPHPAGTCLAVDVLDAASVIRGESSERATFSGRDPWRFLYDVMHGVLAVDDAGEGGIEAVMSLVAPEVWRQSVVTAVRDMIDAVCTVGAFEVDVTTTLRMLQSEMGACVEDGSLAEAFGVAVLARDTVFDVAVSSVELAPDQTA